jgi:hypothetical protein
VSRGENPFAARSDRAYRPAPSAEAAPEPAAAANDEDEFVKITEPGAYPGIDGELYHRIEICDAPSISSTGLKTIEGKSAFHYWYESPLNPNRPPQEQKAHFNVGKGVHDLLLLQGLFPKNYFILPEGFDARLKKWADVNDERDAAAESGIPILTHPQHQMVLAMAEQVEKNELAKALITSGIPEMTLVAKDPETGVWLRTKPDITPDTIDIVPDIKTAISAHPAAFEKQATAVGYFQSAAHYLDVIDLVYGTPASKRRFVLIVVEKEPPHLVQIYQLDDESIQMGRMLNRRALNTFARCLETGVWPGYSTAEQPILQLQATRWFQSEITRRVDAGELSWEN